jgi:hypothetical protein
MKKSKSIIAVLIVLVIVCAFAACSSKSDTQAIDEVTQAVTDSNGELVTDESGEVVTETVQGEIVTDSAGKAVTEVVTVSGGTAVTNSLGNVVTQVVTASSQNTTTTSKSSKTKTTQKQTDENSDSTSTTKAPVKKPSKPSNVSSLKASSVKTDSVKLSWSKVDCTGYQIAVSTDGGFNWSYLEKAYNSGTTYTVKNLTSMTEYSFRVRAYNSNSAGVSASDWKTVKVTTAEDDTSKYITLSFILPYDNNKEDKLTITINGEVVHTENVKCDGSTYTYKTEKKYKGAIDVVATLKNSKISRSLHTDKDAQIDLTQEGIDVIEAEDD